MTKQSDTPRVPDLMEAVFDTCYLLFDLIWQAFYFLPFLMAVRCFSYTAF